MENRNWSYYYFKDEFAATGNEKNKILATCSNYLIKKDVMWPSIYAKTSQKNEKQFDNKQIVIKYRNSVKDFDRIAEEIFGKQEVPTRYINHQQPLIGIVTHSVQFIFNTMVNLNLSNIALEILDVSVISLDRKNEVLTLYLTNTKVHAVVHNDGKVFCSGADSEGTARRTARFLARAFHVVHKGATVKNFKILEVHATGYMPWNIDIEKLYKNKRQNYGLISYTIRNYMGNDNHLELFESGAVNVSSPDIGTLKDVLNNILIALLPFSKARSASENKMVRSILSLGNKTGGFDLDLISS